MTDTETARSMRSISAATNPRDALTLIMETIIIIARRAPKYLVHNPRMREIPPRSSIRATAQARNAPNPRDAKNAMVPSIFESLPTP